MRLLQLAVGEDRRLCRGAGISCGDAIDRGIGEIDVIRRRIDGEMRVHRIACADAVIPAIGIGDARVPLAVLRRGERALDAGAQRERGRDGVIDAAGEAPAIAVIFRDRGVERRAESDRVELAPGIAHRLRVERQRLGGAEAPADDDLRRGVEARPDPGERHVRPRERAEQPGDRQIALQIVLDRGLIGDADGREIIVHLEPGGPADIPAVARQLLLAIGERGGQVGQLIAERGIGIFDIHRAADAQPVGQCDRQRRLDIDRAQPGAIRRVTCPARIAVIGGEAIGRGDREAEDDAASERGDECARGQDAVIDRVARYRVAADRPGGLRRAHDHRPAIDHLAARQDRRGAQRALDPIGIGDRRRVPPQRRGAGIGDLARKGTASAARGLFLKVEGLGIGLPDEGEHRGECAGSNRNFERGGHWYSFTLTLHSNWLSLNPWVEIGFS